MADKTIGTASRDYSTIQGWESARQGTLTEIEKGICYADSVFTELGVDIDGSTTTSSYYMHLTVADWHNGIAGTGVEVAPSGDMGGTTPIIRNDDNYTIVEGLEIYGTSITTWGTNYGSGISFGGNSDKSIARRCIIHDLKPTTSGGGEKGIYCGAGYDDNHVLNNIIYSLTDLTTGAVKYIDAGNNTNLHAFNNTLIKGDCPNPTGINCERNNSSVEIKNNICLDFESGSGDCFDFLASQTHDYNYASDTTTSGETNGLSSQSMANTIISSTAGSEVLLIKFDSNAVGAGVDLGTSQGVNIDILGRDRDSEGDTWDIGAHQFVTIHVSTIGTANRHYSTPTSWEASSPSDLTDTGNIWQGNCYNDSTFTDKPDITGVTVSSSYYRVLSAPSSERHDGTAGTGVKFDPSTDGTCITLNEGYGIVEWLEVTGVSGYGTGGIVIQQTGDTARFNIIHDFVVGTHNARFGIKMGTYETTSTAYCNIIYRLTSYQVDGISYGHGNARCIVCNNVIYTVCTDTSTARGINMSGNKDTSDTKIYNNICLDNTTFDFGFQSSHVHDYNISSDSSATGSNSITGQSQTEVKFLNVSDGSEDFHIYGNSVAVDAGYNVMSLGEYGIIAKDIDNEDRPIGGVWDCGVDEVEALAGVATKYDHYKKLSH